MFFEQGHIYHLYNQGNNRQPIFFERENYLFFLKKVNSCVLPYGDVLAWCLMPNHFHLMVEVREVEIEIAMDVSDGVTSSHPVTKPRQLNDSIAILLRSYTRAINKQQNRTGSLFREDTKVECITQCNGIAPSFYNSHQGTIINITQPEQEYPEVCFNYIHHNPVKAGLVKHPEDWEFSSYRDYFGERKGKLINRERAVELGLIR